MRNALSLLVLAGLAMATETRVAAMGNLYQFILDDEALVIRDNPAYVAKFPNLSVTEMSTQQDLVLGKAYGGIIAKQGPIVAGFYLNNPIYTFPTIDGSRDAHGLTLAMGSGEDFAWGVRFGYAFHREGDTAYTIDGTAYSFSPGFTMPIGNGNLSVSCQLRVSSYSDNSLGPDSILEPVSEFSNLGLDMRYTSPGIINLIAGYRIYRNDNGKKIADSSVTDLTTGGSLFLGINGRPLDAGLVLGGLTIDAYKRRGNGDASLEELILLAGLGSEMNIWRWFIFRSNMSKFLFIYRQERVADPDNPYTFIGSSGFVGSFGMGIVFGSARLDATLSEDLLYNGPYFLTGNDSKFVMALAFLYRFGRG
ncbi:MAG: hypothetical protein ACPL68_04400 [Candidatus Hydrothermia bacterium]